MTDALTPAPKKRNVHSYKTELAHAVEHGLRWEAAADTFQVERDEARTDASHQRELVRHWQEDSAKWFRAFKQMVTLAAVLFSALALIALARALA